VTFEKHRIVSFNTTRTAKLVSESYVERRRCDKCRLFWGCHESIYT